MGELVRGIWRDQRPAGEEFLVTDHGKWITGQAINVDGGTVWGN